MNNIVRNVAYVSICNFRLTYTVRSESRCALIKRGSFFNVLLTAHLSIILDNNQLDTHLIYFTILYYNPLHVSSIICSSSGG